MECPVACNRHFAPSTACEHAAAREHGKLQSSRAAHAQAQADARLLFDWRCAMPPFAINRLCTQTWALPRTFCCAAAPTGLHDDNACPVSGLPHALGCGTIHQGCQRLVRCVHRHQADTCPPGLSLDNSTHLLTAFFSRQMFLNSKSRKRLQPQAAFVAVFVWCTSRCLPALTCATHRRSW